MSFLAINITTIGVLLTERGEHLAEVFLRNVSVVVLINEAKGFLKLLDLSLVEHGKDIGCRTLRALLPGLAGRLIWGDHDKASTCESEPAGV